MAQFADKVGDDRNIDSFLGALRKLGILYVKQQQIGYGGEFGRDGYKLNNLSGPQLEELEALVKTAVQSSSEAASANTFSLK